MRIVFFVLITCFYFVCVTEVSADTAAINGTRLYYEVAGRGEPVVLIHGGLADSRVWDGQFANFSKHFKVIRYDLRGYHNSDFPTVPFSHIEDLHALLKFLNIEKATIVGLSIGGAIALDFALEYPEMVNKLVLASSGLRGDNSPPDEKTIAVYKALKPFGPERAIDLWLETPLFSTIKGNKTSEEKTRAMLSDNIRYWGAVENPIPVTWPKKLTIDRLSEIGKPTLIIVGDKDAPYILKIAETLSSSIKGAQKQMIRGVSHHLNLEKPKEFNRIVKSFLKRGK